MKRLTLIALLLIFTLVLAACGAAETPAPTAVPPTAEPMTDMADTQDEAANTIVDIAVADGRFNTLVAAVSAAGLVETLSSEGPFTVFAPTDDAFAALPEGTIDALLADPQGALTDILLYHVVPGRVMAADVVGLSAATTVGGEDIAISTDAGVVLNGVANVVITDIEASNGVIHVIDAVILPPSMTAEAQPTIVEIAAADGRFETLVAAVTAAGLVETLNSDGPFTVFAPTDDAFAALPEGTVEALLEDPQGALTDILLYHVVSGAVTAADVVELDSATTVFGEDIAIAVENGSVVLNGTATVIITDIEASNGVIHVIDTVILPPSMSAMPGEELPTIVEIAVADGRFETLVTALTAANLVETLSSEGPFTVFAPTDEAFAALPAGTIEALLEDPQGALTDILLYHVVQGKVMAADVVELDAAPTIFGEDITITIDTGAVVLNDTVRVIITDIEASNGVIHVIDAVLLPGS
jgi:transforming growth factor-beta-induced protein